MKKIFVIGLDCAPPQIVFDRKDELPNIKYLIENGTSSPMRSTDPPITIPAWLSMVSSKTPGSMGLYGFRHRKPGTYNDMYFSMSDRMLLIRRSGLVISLGSVISLPPTRSIDIISKSVKHNLLNR